MAGCEPKRLTSYAVLTELLPRASGLKNFSFKEFEGSEEQELEFAPCPVQALHEWLLMNFENQVTLGHVYAWESLVFIVSEVCVDKVSTQAAVLVFDVYAQETQIINFK